jgi:hypothetical protein
VPWKKEKTTNYKSAKFSQISSDQKEDQKLTSSQVLFSSKKCILKIINSGNHFGV